MSQQPYVYDVVSTQDGWRVSRDRNGCGVFISDPFGSPEDAAWCACMLVNSHAGSAALATLGSNADNILQAAYYKDEPGYSECRERELI